MKALSLVTMSLFSLTAFANGGIVSGGIPQPPKHPQAYGYAIKCVNDEGVRVSARQWDDDFALQTRGLDKRTEFVFMRSAQQHDPTAYSMRFDSVEDSKVDVVFTLVKSQSDEVGTGYLHAGGRIVNLMCEWYRKLGFEGCSSHSGRRTFITNAARRISSVGGSLRDVQALARHASLSMTQRYIEMDSEAQRKVVELL